MAYGISGEGEAWHLRGRGNGYVLTVDDRRIYVAGSTQAVPEMLGLEDTYLAPLGERPQHGSCGRVGEPGCGRHEINTEDLKHACCANRTQLIRGHVIENPVDEPSETRSIANHDHALVSHDGKPELQFY